MHVSSVSPISFLENPRLPGFPSNQVEEKNRSVACMKEGRCSDHPRPLMHLDSSRDPLPQILDVVQLQFQ